jgi:hypothetical protein
MSQVQVNDTTPCQRPLPPMAQLCAECYKYEKNAGKPVHDPEANQCPGFLYSDCPVHIRPPLPCCWQESCARECAKAVRYSRGGSR